MAEDQSSWTYNPDNGQSDQVGGDGIQAAEAPPTSARPADVTWSASEYVQHHHGATWYLALGVAAVGVGVILYVLTRSVFSAAIIPVLAIIVGVFASRPPRTIQYGLSDSGLSIGSRLYSYGNFKSFSVIDEGAVQSILLMPIKRFMPPVSAYFSVEDGDKIVNKLGDYLPFETAELDGTQRLARKLRF